MPSKVVVTGASSGIGKATAVALAAEGHTVFATARRVERLADLAATAPDRIVPVAMDVRDPDSVQRAREQVESHLGGAPDVLINNAGIAALAPLETLSSESIRDLFETNVLGLIDVTRAFVGPMRERGSGRIVNVGSVLGRVTVHGTGAYGATKHAVEAISDALRLELAGFGVLVTLVEPSFTATEIDTDVDESGPTIPAYAPMRTAMDRYVKKQMAAAMPADAVAAVIVKAALVKRPRARYVVPGSFGAVLTMNAVMPERLIDAAKQRELRRAV